MPLSKIGTNQVSTLAATNMPAGSILQIKHYMVLSPWLKLKFLSQAITNYRENIGQAFLEEKSVARNKKVVSITCMHFSVLLV